MEQGWAYRSLHLLRCHTCESVAHLLHEGWVLTQHLQGLLHAL